MHKKNDSRVFVFGAGVSKAVAGAPVMSELFCKMKQKMGFETWVQQSYPGLK